LRRKDGRNEGRVGEERMGERMERVMKKKRLQGIDQRGKRSDPETGLYPRCPFGSMREQGEPDGED
jgi:hypothetical protein